MNITTVLQQPEINKGFIAKGIDHYASHSQEYGHESWFINSWVYHRGNKALVIMNADVCKYKSTSRLI